MRMIVVAAFMSSVASTAVLSQEPAALTPVARADSLRNAGNFLEAADSLKSLLTREPGNGDAARMLAQTLYWMKDFAASGAAYESALAQHPGDHSLELDYARMLIETGNNSRAAALLDPLVLNDTTRARASALLGTMHYWSGSLTRAARELATAVRMNPGDSASARQLYEIRAIAAPWISLSPSGLHDDQPVDRIGVTVNAGWFVNPLNAILFSVTPGTLRSTDTLSATIASGEIGVRHVAPDSHAELVVAGGAFRQSSTTTLTAVTWRGSLNVPLASSFSIYANARRSPYLATTGSVSRGFMTTAGSIGISRSNESGWIGESAVRYERFPDENSSNAAFAWTLLPIVRSVEAVVRVGYAISYQNSQEMRFFLDAPLRPGTIPDLRGHYSYYTPRDVIEHTALMSASVRPSARTRVNLSGGYGFYATEKAPQIIATDVVVDPALTIAPRSFHPWNARLRFESQVNRQTSLTGMMDHMKTAFYSATSASIGITWKILPNPRS